MAGIVEFVRNLVFVALCMAAGGALVETTGLLGKAAIEVHKVGGMSFRGLNRQLLGDGK